MSPYKIGLMGCGVVAEYGHLPALLETTGLKLQAIYDPDAAAIRRMQEKFDIPRAFTDETEFFASGLDALSITSPAPCHRANVLHAARCKLPVLCEKPLAMDVKEAGEMIEAMQNAGVPLHTAFCYRFSPCALKIRELVRQGAVGEVKALRLIYNWNCHGKYEFDQQGRRKIQGRREARMWEGGPMVDCGTHQIDLARFWLGSDIVRFSAHGAWVDEYEAPDHMWLHLDHANGAHTVVEISYSYHHTSKNQRAEFVYELIGTEGVIRYDREARRFFMENAAGLQEFTFDHEKSFGGMYAEWVKVLAGGDASLLSSAEEGMEVVAIARAATDQIIQSRPRR